MEANRRPRHPMRRHTEHAAFRLDTRIATAALALVLAIVSLPILSGWVACDAQCAISLDICHPAQSVDASHAPLFGSPPQIFTLIGCSQAAIFATDAGNLAITDRHGDAPEPPPPEILAEILASFVIIHR
jgi:hypothetical protein